MEAERPRHRPHVARVPLEAVDAVFRREAPQRLRVVVPSGGVGEVPHAADAAPPPHDARVPPRTRLVVGEDVLAVDHVALPVAQQLVLAAVGAHERRRPDHRLPPLLADAAEHAPGVGEVGRVEPVAAVVREPAAVHDVDTAREAAPRKCLGVGVDARLPHALDRDLNPVVPLGLREEKLGRRASVEREMLRARGEIGVPQRRPRHHGFDLLHVGGDSEDIVRERIDERPVAPHVAARA